MRILRLLCCVFYLLPQSSGLVFPTWNDDSLLLLKLDGFSSMMLSNPFFFLSVHNTSLCEHGPSGARLRDISTSCGCIWSLGVPSEPLLVMFSLKAFILKCLETKCLIPLGSLGRCLRGSKLRQGLNPTLDLPPAPHPEMPDPNHPFPPPQASHIIFSQSVCHNPEIGPQHSAGNQRDAMSLMVEN